MGRHVIHDEGGHSQLGKATVKLQIENLQLLKYFHCLLWVICEKGVASIPPERQKITLFYTRTNAFLIQNDLAGTRKGLGLLELWESDLGQWRFLVCLFWF